MIYVTRAVNELRSYVSARRAAGQRIALVPTMGALHDGHMELVRQGLTRAQCVIATIFVNPKQFGPNEDLAAYPRTWEADLEKLTHTGAQAVFYPSVTEMYPPVFSTTVSVAGISSGLCGAARPGHFDGVATVVTKLLLMTLPDIALFGEKDYQQLAVIRRLAEDLNIPVNIIGVPTVRDAHGLALSSRNAYLSAPDLDIARRLNKILFDMAAEIGAGGDVAGIIVRGKERIAGSGFSSCDYLEVCDAHTLASVMRKDGRDLRVLAAVRLGKTRLIDNVAA